MQPYVLLLAIRLRYALLLEPPFTSTRVTESTAQSSYLIAQTNDCLSYSHASQTLPLGKQMYYSNTWPIHSHNFYPLASSLFPKLESGLLIRRLSGR
jgi:hypothetical protein